MTRASLAAIFATLSFFAFEPTARACGNCGCGDPTLTAVGSEKPQANRLRLAFDVRHRTDAVGRARDDELHLSEQRLDTQLAFAPTEWLYLLASLPLLRRTVRTVDLAEHRALGTGDLELRAKVFAWSDRDFRPRHVIAFLGGASVPTSPLLRDEKGKPLPPELQGGTGTVAPLVGISYAAFAYPFSLYSSAFVSVPLATVSGLRASRSLRGSLLGQVDIAHRLALRAGPELRIDTTAIEDGETARDTGGTIVFGAADALFSLASDVVLFAGIRVPILRALAGRHDEGVFLNAGLAFDLL